MKSIRKLYENAIMALRPAGAKVCCTCPSAARPDRTPSHWPLGRQGASKTILDPNLDPGRVKFWAMLGSFCHILGRCFGIFIEDRFQMRFWLLFDQFPTTLGAENNENVWFL